MIIMKRINISSGYHHCWRIMRRASHRSSWVHHSTLAHQPNTSQHPTQSAASIYSWTLAPGKKPSNKMHAIYTDWDFEGMFSLLEWYTRNGITKQWLGNCERVQIILLNLNRIIFWFLLQIIIKQCALVYKSSPETLGVYFKWKSFNYNWNLCFIMFMFRYGAHHIRTSGFNRESFS